MSFTVWWDKRRRPLRFDPFLIGIICIRLSCIRQVGKHVAWCPSRAVRWSWTRRGATRLSYGVHHQPPISQHRIRCDSSGNVAVGVFCAFQRCQHVWDLSWKWRVWVFCWSGSRVHMTECFSVEVDGRNQLLGLTRSSGMIWTVSIRQF